MPYFLYSVCPVLSMLKLTLEIGEGIWVLDYNSRKDMKRNKKRDKKQKETKKPGLNHPTQNIG